MATPPDVSATHHAELFPSLPRVLLDILAPEGIKQYYLSSYKGPRAGANVWFMKCQIYC